MNMLLGLWHHGLGVRLRAFLDELIEKRMANAEAATELRFLLSSWPI
jgi:hypothetical protein